LVSEVFSGRIAPLRSFLTSSSDSSSDAAQHHVDAAALALLDVSQTCVYRITNTYGAVLSSVVAQARPLVGTSADAVALLDSFLAHQQ
jgi:hypothetical protein